MILSMTNLKAIGARVRQLRKQNALAQDALAEVIGVSRSTIAGIESGGDRGGIETIVAIADYFRVPMDWLLARKVPPGGPDVGQYVERADELAILRFWNNLTFDDKKAAVKMLSLPVPAEALLPAINPTKVEQTTPERQH